MSFTIRRQASKMKKKKRIICNKCFKITRSKYDEICEPCYDKKKNNNLKP